MTYRARCARRREVTGRRLVLVRESWKVESGVIVAHFLHVGPTREGLTPVVRLDREELLRRWPER